MFDASVELVKWSQKYGNGTRLFLNMQNGWPREFANFAMDPLHFAIAMVNPFLKLTILFRSQRVGPISLRMLPALCPNCHRKMHVLHLPADVTKLKNKSSSRA